MPTLSFSLTVLPCVLILLSLPFLLFPVPSPKIIYPNVPIEAVVSVGTGNVLEPQPVEGFGWAPIFNQIINRCASFSLTLSIFLSTLQHIWAPELLRQLSHIDHS